MVGDGAEFGLIEHERNFVGQRIMRVRIVGDDQGVLAAVVAEEVVQPELFHQAADEIERRLAILNAVLKNGIAGAGLTAVLEIGEPGIAKDLCDDLERRLLLEDPAVGVPAQQPDPRPTST